MHSYYWNLDFWKPGGYPFGWRCWAAGPFHLPVAEPFRCQAAGPFRRQVAGRFRRRAAGPFRRPVAGRVAGLFHRQVAGHLPVDWQRRDDC